jgi:hypothetical protein
MNGPAQDDMKVGASSLFALLGDMKSLEHLSLTWLDRNESLSSWQMQYLVNWGILRDLLFQKTWCRLHTLALANFLTPDTILNKFLVKHTATLRELSIAGCFLGYSRRHKAFHSWGAYFPEDNCRKMLEELRNQIKLDRTEVSFEWANDEGYALGCTWSENTLDEFVRG